MLCHSTLPLSHRAVMAASSGMGNPLCVCFLFHLALKTLIHQRQLSAHHLRAITQPASLI